MERQRRCCFVSQILKLSEVILLIAMEQIGIESLERARKQIICRRCRVILKVSWSCTFAVPNNYSALVLCVFPGEAICGWMHDTSNDLDFERRNGYNNRTISIHTGPSADHTTGMPFNGHYMVINTNTEVFTKKARLISPLYRLNATKLCFQLFYHMYGISVGTLKVYAKPESVELQDIFMEEESEAKNDYVIFEIKGMNFHFNYFPPNNAWQRFTSCNVCACCLLQIHMGMPGIKERE